MLPNSQVNHGSVFIDTMIHHPLRYNHNDETPLDILGTGNSFHLGGHQPVQ
jgi:hypothetical protein